MLETVLGRKTLFLAAGIALLIGSPEAATAQIDDSGGYSDRIHLKNGDAITGNMKELDRGKLRVKTRTMDDIYINWVYICLLYTSPSPRDATLSRMPSSA